VTADPAARPSVTLVVAMRNEGPSIGRCLASIAAQDYPADRLEVLVFDGESTDDSVALAAAFVDGRPGWSVRTNPQRIQAAAWNLGIQAASREIVGIVSGHAELGPGYVETAVDTLLRTGADMVGGTVRAVADGAIGAAIAVATSTPFGVGGARHHYLTEPAEVDTVFMGVARRSTWLRYPFDEEFVRNQDDELSYRLLDGGGRIVCDPAIESSYRSRSTLRGLWGQYFDYGFWKVRVIQAHPRQARFRHFAPLTLVTTLGGAALLGIVSRKARMAAALELGLYAAATGAAAARYRDRDQRGSGALLAIVYPILHVSYGTGMLRGLWHFRDRLAALRQDRLGREVASTPGSPGLDQGTSAKLSWAKAAPRTGAPRAAMALYGDLTYDSRVRKEARTLAEAGYEVTIVCLADQASASDLPANVKVVIRQPPGSAVIPGSFNPFFAAAGGRIAALRGRVGWLVAYVHGLRAWGRLAVDAAGRVDVWHAHDLTGLAAIIPNLRTGVPVVYDSHELFLETGTALRLPAPVRHLFRAYERRLVSRCSAVITVNDEIADVLHRRYRPRRIEVVHNCPSLWSPPPTGSPLLRQAAGIPLGAPIVLYHGGLMANRGVEQLMDALLAGFLEDVHLVLMGLGDKRGEYESAARSAKWQGRVHVLDPVQPSLLLPWVASADVGLMPNPGLTLNDRFSSPNKLFECLAAGTPVIASDFPTMRRIVIDNPGGPLGGVCDPTSALAIADAIRSIVRLDAVDMEALRARCLSAAAERWNWEQEGMALLSIYSEILPLRD